MVRRSYMAALIAAVILASLQPVMAQRVTRRLFVSATDSSGTPVSGLGKADFRLTEGGMPREISRVAADVPMRVLLLVESSSAVAPMITDFRSALQAFAEGLSPALEVGFMTTAGQLKVRVPPTMDRQKLRSEFQAFSPESGGNVVIEALLECDGRFFKNAPDRWPVFLLVATDAVSTRGDQPILRYNKFLSDFMARGGSAHAVLIKGKQPGTLSEIVTNLVANTNGVLETMIGSSPLADKMKGLAARISADHAAMVGRYEVEFTSDAKAGTRGDLEVAVTRSGVTVRASARRPF